MPSENNSKEWQGFMHSPLTMFAGVFSLLEVVVVAFLSRSEKPVDPVDDLVVILLTVTLFVIVVLARPQALYPPSEWKDPTPAPDARIALVVLLVFIFCIGGGWAMKFAGPGWAQALGGSGNSQRAQPSN